MSFFHNCSLGLLSSQWPDYAPAKVQMTANDQIVNKAGEFIQHGCCAIHMQEEERYLEFDSPPCNSQFEFRSTSYDNHLGLVLTTTPSQNPQSPNRLKRVRVLWYKVLLHYKVDRQCMATSRRVV